MLNTCKKMLLTGLCVISCAAYANDDLPAEASAIEIGWKAPTKRVDGEKITSSDIAGYELKSSCQSALIPIAGNKTLYTFPITLPHDCAYSLRAVDRSGLRSEFTRQLKITLVPLETPMIQYIKAANLNTTSP